MNAKHLLRDRKREGNKRNAGVLSAETLKSRDAAFQHLTVDMLTKPSFITDSQACEHSNSVTLIGRIVQNKLERPISLQN